MLAALLAGCTEEVQNGEGNLPKPDDTDSGGRREVLLTLKNKLVLKDASTKAETPIATTEENKIATLDVYVFASAEENGTYTYQERFAYRADGSNLPSGATELELTPGKDDTQTTGLLNLKKGLYVKLYAIANQATLVDPAHEDQTVADDTFVPITFNEPGKQGTTIAAIGQPDETTFLAYHTPLLDAATESDILGTPLAMSGAYTTPLDLTDFENSARMQIGFKLTRLAARFDIVNNAETSRFTIESISMAKGRKGATFFPIRVFGQTPEAAADELITYPARAFDGEKANKGTQTGAFYTYPSPSKDNGYIILKGTYQVNKTETKEVTYQIPFIQETADGGSTFLEINNNHRYTIGITEADDYHLDFTLTVADWADDGSIDEYKPEDGSGALNITIPPTFDGDTQYDPDTRIVSMSLKENSSFDVKIETNSALTIQKTYVGGLEAQQYDWLVISDPVTTETKANLTSYDYTFSLKNDYNKLRYPRAVVRFTNAMDGSETILFVDPYAAPQLIETKQTSGNYNTFDAAGQSISMYNVANSSKVKINMLCPDGIVLKNKAEWLNVEDQTTSTDLEKSYELTLNKEVLDETTGTVVFQNEKNADLITTITVNLQNTEIVADNQSVTASTSGSTNIPVQSPHGVKITKVEWGDGGEWFTYGNSATTGNGNITITQKSSNTSTVMKAATIFLENNITGGKSKEIVITPTNFSAPSLSATSRTLDNVINENTTTTTLTFTPKAGFFEYSIRDENIASLEQNGNTITITAKYKGSTYIDVKNKSDNSQSASCSIKVNRDYEGKSIWKYNGYYIAPVDASSSTGWSANPTHCNGKSGMNWYVPTADEWRTIIGGTTGESHAAQSVFNEYTSKGVFVIGGRYWSTTSYTTDRAYTLDINSTYLYVTTSGKTNTSVGYNTRCVARN